MIKAKRYVALVCALFSAFVCFSAEISQSFDITAYPLPGFYNTPVTVVLSAERALYFSLNGSAVAPVTAPVFLDVAAGEEKEYVFDLFYAPADPAATPVPAGKITYVLDCRVPARVGYRCKKNGDSMSVWFDTTEPGVIMYSVYNPLSCTVVTGSLDAGKTDKFAQPKISVASNAVFSAFLVDRAGNKGMPVVVDLGLDVQYTEDFSIINPLPGTWENKQMLVIGNYSASDILYTLDGSDPRVNGSVYEQPVLIDSEGQIQLRVASRYGTVEKSVVFVSHAGAVPAELSCLPSDSIGTIREFAELVLPAESQYVFGAGTVPYLEGKTLAVSSVPGANRYLPITVSFGGKTYRSVLFLNGRSDGAVVAASDISPVVPISGKLYYAVTFPFGSSYSLDGGAWKTTDHPLFVSRATPHELRWYNTAYKNGAMQKLFLTGQTSDIVLNGIPQSGRSSGPVMITPENPRLELRYEVGFDRIPPTPSKDSPVLGNGILVGAPLGDQFNCVIRVASFRDQYSDGDVITSFVVDRKIPSPPIATVGAQQWSRTPVVVTWNVATGDDAAVLSGFAATPIRINESRSITYPVLPELKTSSEQTVVNGDIDCAVAYTAAACALDESGNKSRVTVVHGIVERNAWYVSTADSVDTSVADGSPDHPYKSLDAVLSQIERYKDPLPCTVYVSGPQVITSTHVLNRSVVILSDSRSQDASLTLSGSAFISIAKQGSLTVRNLSVADIRRGEKNAALLVTGGKLVLENCSLKAASSRSVIRGERAAVIAKNCSFDFSDVAAVSALVFYDSTVDFFATDITVNGTSFVQGLSITGGECIFRSGTLKVTAVEAGGAAVAVSAARATFKTDAAVFAVVSDAAGRAVDAFSSRVFVTDSVFRQVTKKTSGAKCGAVVLDPTSVICKNSGNKTVGFSAFLDTSGGKN